MEPTQELIDALYREEVRAARRMPTEEKLLAGGRIFDQLCDEILVRIRSAFPQASDDDARALLRVCVPRLWETDR